MCHLRITYLLKSASFMLKTSKRKKYLVGSLLFIQHKTKKVANNDTIMQTT